MFLCLYYSVTINESKEKFRIVFCCFSTIKNIAAPLSSPNLTKYFTEEYSNWFVLINLYQHIYKF